MGIIQNRLSTEPIPADFIPPDELSHSPTESFEAGPIALNDPSEGTQYQSWQLTYNNLTGDFTVTPLTVGTPSVVLNVMGVTHASLAFDNNGHVNIAYMVGSDAYLYWYDTDVASWVTTLLAAGTTSPVITLDDKRRTQTNANDILLWYTRQQPDTSWNLYKREQRERFLNETLMRANVFPYIYTAGMHVKWRVQLLLYGPQAVVMPPVIPPGPPSPQANLDFEFGDVYWNKTGDAVINQLDPFAGGWSARLTTGTLENSVYTAITPEDPVFVSCVVKGTEATTIALGFKFYNSAKALIATETAIKNVITNWTQITHSLFSPVNAVYMRIFVIDSTTSGIVSFDNFNFFAIEDTGSFYNVELDAEVYMTVELDALTPFEVAA